MGIVQIKYPGVNSYNHVQQAMPKITDELKRKGVATTTIIFEDLDKEHGYGTIVLVGCHSLKLPPE